MKPKPKKNDQFAGGGKGIKPVMAWAIINPANNICYEFIHTNRSICIELAHSEFLNSWNTLKSLGYRIVRVRVEVVLGRLLGMVVCGRSRNGK